MSRLNELYQAGKRLQLAYKIATPPDQQLERVPEDQAVVATQDAAQVENMEKTKAGSRTGAGARGGAATGAAIGAIAAALISRKENMLKNVAKGGAVGGVVGGAAGGAAGYYGPGLQKLIASRKGKAAQA